MRPWRAAALLLGSTLLVTACGSQPAPPPPPPTPVPVAVSVPADAAQLVAADDRFGVDLLDALPQNGNVALSPASVAIALQMVASGARGTTATEMARVLHLPDAASAATSAQALLTGLAAAEHDPTTTLKVANTVWTQQGLPVRPAFTNTLRTSFGSATHTIDFTRDDAVGQIDKTVSNQTAGLIPQLFPPGSLDDSTVMALTNAVYLKASWAHAFVPGQTKPGPFTLADGTVKNVPMMSSSPDVSYGYADTPSYQAVTLPYTGGKLAFTVLLPKTTFTQLTNTLRNTGLPAVLKGIRPTAVDLVLPKFSVRTNLDLTATLRQLGMPDAFGPSADFSGISPQPLAIQTVAHDAVVTVDEHGTTAAAASGVGMEATSLAVGAIVRVNRPFVFVITDTATGAPLFLGRVSDPGD